MTAPGEFEPWYEEAWPRLVRSATALTGCPETAEDVAAEAFACAFERWDQVVTMTSPDAWLHEVTLNLVRSRWRRNRTVLRWLSRQRAVEPSVVPEEADTELWVAVRSLSPRTQEVIILRYVADLTQAEIARSLHISPGTVASTLHAGRRTLAETLGIPSKPDNQEVSDHA